MSRKSGGLRWLFLGVGWCLLAAVNVAAQTGAVISGRVASDAGAPLIGAQVVVLNQTTGSAAGAISGADGQFRVPGLRAGTYRVEVRLIGYGTKVVDPVVLTANQTRQLDFSLGSVAVALDAIEVFSERAVERRTPVAYSDVDKAQMERNLGSRDIPLILNTTPSVYSTAQGGGAGDARVTVRGFNQRNLGVLINGVPVNDMENGWVYWSNWDGVGDATSSIQLQRGLSAVNLATPSIGGTLNIITDPAAIGRRVMVKQELGNDDFMKTTIGFSSGLVNDKFAVLFQGVRKTGDGVIDGTWTDAWAYYGGATYIINPKNRLELFALGAPQMHGQLQFKQNIAAFSHDFARGLEDYDTAAFTRYKNPQGRTYNQNFNFVTVNYTGKQYFAGDIISRHDRGFLNQSVNHFHKPQVNLNWYSQVTQDLLWSTVAYYSGGKGGGSGTFGSLLNNTTDFPSSVINWDATITRNINNVDAQGRSRSLGILRSSRNNQWTIGAISKLKYELNQQTTLEVGLDWRTAEIEHYRDVVDLLGGEYFLCTGGCKGDFDPAAGMEVQLGDVIDYNNTNTVDWVGGFVQGEWATDKASTYGMFGLSTIKYTLIDFFRRDPATDAPLELKSDQIPGFQVKGGGLLNLTDALGVFANAGYVAKVPIFDDVISDINAVINDDPKNEKFLSLEAGSTYRRRGSPVSFKGNLYYTTWKDRASTRRFFDENGEDYYITMTGLNQRHMGAELEAAWQPSHLFRFDGAASFGKWEYTNDVEGTFRPEGSDSTSRFAFYIDNLKVGDAPQTQLAYGISVFPVEDLYLQASARSYSNHYADFNPFSRTNSADRVQSWKAPGYTVVDLHAGYTINLRQFGRARVQANVFNLFDEFYIQDALDNSQFNAFAPFTHAADDAEVFIGLPRTFTVSLQLMR